MKTILIYIITLFVLGFIFSCKKKELLTYNNERILYFNNPFVDQFNKPPVDSIDFSFRLIPDEVKSTELKIPIRLLGKQLDVATPYDIQVITSVSTAVEGTDFELPSQLSFPAKSSLDTLRLKINRTTKLANQVCIIALQLKPTINFSNNLMNLSDKKDNDTKTRIFISDMLPPPPGWVGGADLYLGTFSKKKLFLLYDLQTPGGIISNYFYNNIGSITGNYQIHGQRLNLYLKNQRDAGTPVLEKDGTPMKAGHFYN